MWLFARSNGSHYVQLPSWSAYCILFINLKDNADATHVLIADKGESDKVCWFVLLTTAQAIVQQYFENEFNQVSCFCTMPIAREDT
jgi:hypothetical protein